jgi:hypothetical protein
VVDNVGKGTVSNLQYSDLEFFFYSQFKCLKTMKQFKFFIFLMGVITLTLVSSCNKDELKSTSETLFLGNRTSGFQNVTQQQIDQFIANSFQIARNALENEDFIAEYQIIKSSNPIDYTFIENSLNINYSLMQGEGFQQIVQQINNNEELIYILVERALALGFVDDLNDDFGGDSAKCSGGYVGWNVLKGALGVAACSAGPIGCAIGLMETAESVYNVVCCWHC